MQYFTANNEYIVVLKKDENLHDCLRQLVKETGITTAWLQGLGAALELEIGYYDLDAKDYKWKQLHGQHEITSMQGNIVQGSEGPLFHIHGTFSDTDCKAYGGHINRLIVGGTCELLVKPVSAELTRQVDQATGLNLLCAVSNA